MRTAVGAATPRPSDDELLAAIGEMDLHEVRRFAAKFHMALVRKGLCVVCGAKVVLRQGGRCVYGNPCGHRQYQGRIPHD